MSAFPTFSEIRLRCMREKLFIQCLVVMADDSVKVVAFGPRGGWKFAG